MNKDMMRYICIYDVIYGIVKEKLFWGNACYMDR